jgi:hypothetical protein
MLTVDRYLSEEALILGRPSSCICDNSTPKNAVLLAVEGGEKGGGPSGPMAFA